MFFKLGNNHDRHKSSDELEFEPNQTFELENIFFLLACNGGNDVGTSQIFR